MGRLLRLNSSTLRCSFEGKASWASSHEALRSPGAVWRLYITRCALCCKPSRGRESLVNGHTTMTQRHRQYRALYGGCPDCGRVLVGAGI